jgi:hypothetical protein
MVLVNPTFSVGSISKPVSAARLQSAVDIEFETVARGQQLTRSFIAESRVTL